MVPVTATYTDVLPTQTSTSETVYLQSSFLAAETDTVGKISTIQNTNQITTSMYNTMTIFPDPELGLTTSIMNTVSETMLYTTASSIYNLTEPEAKVTTYYPDTVPETTPEKTKDFNLTCYSFCYNKHSANVDPREKEHIRKEIEKVLKVKKDNLSSHTRKKTCAKDDRPSSAAIGTVAATILIIAIACVILADINTIKIFIFRMVQHIMNFCRKLINWVVFAWF